MIWRENRYKVEYRRHVLTFLSFTTLIAFDDLIAFVLLHRFCSRIGTTLRTEYISYKKTIEEVLIRPDTK